MQKMLEICWKFAGLSTNLRNLNHLSSLEVTKGMFVNAGDVLGLSGSSGMSTGPHLHLTTKKDGKVFDPDILLNFTQKRNIYYHEG